MAQAAFDLAEREGRRVTVVHKANVVRVGDGLWRAVCLEVGECIQRWKSRRVWLTQ